MPACIRQQQQKANQKNRKLQISLFQFTLQIITNIHPLRSIDLIRTQFACPAEISKAGLCGFIGIIDEKTSSTYWEQGTEGPAGILKTQDGKLIRAEIMNRNYLLLVCAFYRLSLPDTQVGLPSQNTLLAKPEESAIYQLLKKFLSIFLGLLSCFCKDFRVKFSPVSSLFGCHKH